MLFTFILTIKPLHLIKCCCSSTYKYKLLSGSQLSGGKKYPTLSNTFKCVKIEKYVIIEKSGRRRPGRGGGFGNSDTPGQGEGGWFENPRFWRTSYVDGPLASYLKEIET